ncbi:MAG: hypothetical protein WC178_05745 [Candidatus Paceibacterota bacterium]
MDYKQKSEKPFILFLIIFSLLINLFYLYYERAYESGNYAVYNNKIVNDYESNYFNIPVEVKQQAICSNLKSPFGDIANYYRLIFLASSLTAISVLFVFLVMILKKCKKIALSRKYIVMLMCIELISISIFTWAFILESDYYYAYCVKFL